jgi:hypothetical protein
VLSAPRTISSAWTPFYKFVFPILWVIICCVAAPGSDIPRGLLVLVMLIVGFWLWYVLGRPLLVVRVDERFLHMSNYRREIRVPLSDVSGITDNRLMNPRTITIQLGRPTAFGSRLIFMPKLRFIFFFSRHPAVAELNELIATGKASG